jgi:general secretion pathway protein A
MLCRTLLQQLDAPVHVSVVLDPCITPDALLLQMLTDFGVIHADVQAAAAQRGMPLRRQMMVALQRFLVSLASSGGYAVVVIDEAQHLRRSVLEQIRLLLNLETDETKLLQIVLVGQPELDRLLRQPEMQQLDQRVARRCELEPLGANEVSRYIERRLTIAKRLSLEDAETDDVEWDVSFTPGALRAITTRSRGIPRVVNLVCDRAIEIACARGMHTIDTRVVRTALKRIDVGGHPHFRFHPIAAAAAMGVMAVAGGALAWTSLAPAMSEPVMAPPPLFAAGESPTDGAGRAYSPVGFRELPVAESFNVLVTSSRATARTDTVAAQIESSGLPVSIAQDGLWRQVIVGPYISETQAAGAQQRLAALGFSGTQMFVEPGDPLGQSREERSSASPLVSRLVVSQP